MYYYNDKGEMDWTTDEEKVRRYHTKLMLSTSQYPLNPAAAGRLHEKLGYAPIDISRAEALSRIRTVLAELGYSASISDVLEFADGSWKLAVQVGSNA